MELVASLSLEWFLLRAYRITASIAAIAIGLSADCSPQALYFKYTTSPLEQIPDNEPMRRGRIREPFVIANTEPIVKSKITESSYVSHPVFWWLASTPDGDIEHDNLRHPEGADGSCSDPQCRSFVECKAPYYCPYVTPPLKYVVQTFMQMFTGGRHVTYLTMEWAEGECMRVWQVWWSEEAWMWMFVRLIIFIYYLYIIRTEPPVMLLPNVSYANKELMETAFVCKPENPDGGPDVADTEEYRRKIAVKHKISPKDLLPHIKIVQIRYDPDVYTYIDGVKVRKDTVVTGTRVQTLGCMSNKRAVC